jgi:hypothetical protein
MSHALKRPSSITQMRLAAWAFLPASPNAAKFPACQNGGQAPLAKRRRSVKGAFALFTCREKPRDNEKLVASPKAQSSQSLMIVSKA